MTFYYVRRDPDEPVDASVWHHILEPHTNLHTGEADFKNQMDSLTSLESDLLLIASSVFAADRATQRGEREDIARHVKLSIPIVNIGKLLPLVPHIEGMLRTLSNDSWELEFRQIAGKPEVEEQMPLMRQGKTLLFSGGLDSLAAAIEFGSEGLTLVSHKTHNTRTDKTQRDLAGVLQNTSDLPPFLQFFVSSRDGGPTDLKHAVENTQRTRSFLFLTLGALVARRVGNEEIVYLAENGQMAIHLPLTTARIGAFSTHTAHPDFLTKMSDFLKLVLNVPFTVTNPYVHKTKAEVVKVIVERFPNTLFVANSCWMNARLPKGVTHCGECIPCYIRRIAIEAHLTDSTAYNRDVWREDIFALSEDDNGRRNIVDLTEFMMSVLRLDNTEMMTEWPSLYSPHLDAPEVIAMYRRFAQEASTVLGRYPSLAALLS